MEIGTYCRKTGWIFWESGFRGILTIPIGISGFVFLTTWNRENPAKIGIVGMYEIVKCKVQDMKFLWHAVCNELNQLLVHLRNCRWCWIKFWPGYLAIYHTKTWWSWSILRRYFIMMWSCQLCFLCLMCLTIIFVFNVFI